MAVGFTTSGNSTNVVAALEYAKGNGLKTIAFTKSGGGKCAPLADVLLDIPSEDTPRVQEVGMLVYHIICEIVEAAMAEE